MLYLSFFIFIVAVICAILQSSHFLSVLLILELMTLSLYFVSSFTLGMSVSFSSVSFALLFLTFGVYEAANGLGLLVSRTRASGVDHMSGLFSIKF